ncbi:hypothetical protein TTRE_0000760001 [Trichuris trichiura]|uniref:Uncharacterized protein n=1 Tax=Trichuris trichiura TaxID=36087 RepID=A0A077ZHI9_TRITR|nr:hypothetical protein TTRE_0000760001 [Trichuris trichiura]
MRRGAYDKDSGRGDEENMHNAEDTYESLYAHRDASLRWDDDDDDNTSNRAYRGNTRFKESMEKNNSSALQAGRWPRGRLTIYSSDFRRRTEPEQFDFNRNRSERYPEEDLPCSSTRRRHPYLGVDITRPPLRRWVSWHEDEPESQPKQGGYSASMIEEWVQKHFGKGERRFVRTFMVGHFPVRIFEPPFQIHFRCSLADFICKFLSAGDTFQSERSTMGSESPGNAENDATVNSFSRSERGARHDSADGDNFAGDVPVDSSEMMRPAANERARRPADPPMWLDFSRRRSSTTDRSSGRGRVNFYWYHFQRSTQDAVVDTLSHRVDYEHRANNSPVTSSEELFIRRIDDKAAEPAKKDSNAFFYRSPDEYVQSNTAHVNNPSMAAGAMCLALRVLEVKTTVNRCESEESDHGDDMLAWSYCDDLSDCSLDPVNLVCDVCSSRMKSKKLVLEKDPAKCKTTDRCIQVDIACSDVEVSTVQTP